MDRADLKARMVELSKKCGPALEAMGDRNRQAIVVLLGDHDRMNVGELTRHLTLSRPAVSHHLKVLLQAGLVGVERIGTENYYYPSMVEPLQDLKELISVIEALCHAQNDSR